MRKTAFYFLVFFVLIFGLAALSSAQKDVTTEGIIFIAKHNVRRYGEGNQKYFVSVVKTRLIKGEYESMECEFNFDKYDHHISVTNESNVSVWSVFVNQDKFPVSFGFSSARFPKSIIYKEGLNVANFRIGRELIFSTELLILYNSTAAEDIVRRFKETTDAQDTECIIHWR